MRERANRVYVLIDTDEVPMPQLDPSSPSLRDADLVVLALGMKQDLAAFRKSIAMVDKATRAPVLIFGSKNFGDNINPFGRVPAERRPIVMAMAAEPYAAINARLKTEYGARYIDMIGMLGGDGRLVHVFDERGNPLTPDRYHLTRYGAQFVAKRLDRAMPDAWQRLKELGERD